MNDAALIIKIPLYWEPWSEKSSNTKSGNPLASVHSTVMDMDSAESPAVKL